jgi:hypothetical protein
MIGLREAWSMKRQKKRKCLNCRAWFQPDPRNVRHQRYCSEAVSDSGAKARFYQAVCEAKLASIIKVDLRSDLLTYEIDERALARARMMDGKLILVTNVPDFTPAGGGSLQGTGRH